MASAQSAADLLRALSSMNYMRLFDFATLAIVAFHFKPDVLNTIASAMREERQCGQLGRRRLLRSFTGQKLGPNVEACMRADNNSWADEGPMEISATVSVPPIFMHRGNASVEVKLLIYCAEDDGDMGFVELYLSTSRLQNGTGLGRRSPAKVCHHAVLFTTNNGAMERVVTDDDGGLLELNGVAQRRNGQSWAEPGDEHGVWTLCNLDTLGDEFLSTGRLLCLIETRVIP